MRIFRYCPSISVTDRDSDNEPLETYRSGHCNCHGHWRSVTVTVSEDFQAKVPLLTLQIILLSTNHSLKSTIHTKKVRFILKYDLNFFAV